MEIISFASSQLFQNPFFVFHNFHPMSKTGRQWWEVKCAVVVTGSKCPQINHSPPNARWNTETSTQTAFNLQEFNNIATFMRKTFVLWPLISAMSASRKNRLGKLLFGFQKFHLFCVFISFVKCSLLYNRSGRKDAFLNIWPPAGLPRCTIRLSPCKGVN